MTPYSWVDFYVKVCAQKDSTGVYRAEANVSWEHNGSDDINFDKLELHLRLERYDVAVKGAVCDFQTRVSATYASAKCQTAWTSAAPPLTADATMIYDVNQYSGDDLRWDLAGSPSI
ncbi:hypothetical protein ACF05T_29250 [Streptomyces lateritius]|uniref:Uncharacterized protein n=1 Tax=Streptomyces lateritius TaxID=67313 RepID=A0ABW6YJU1_9ACTN